MPNRSNTLFPRTSLIRRICVAADGSYVRPALILSRKTYDAEFVEYGLAPKKIEIYSQNHAWIDSDTFFDWPKHTLVPDLQRTRVAFDYLAPAFPDWHGGKRSGDSGRFSTGKSMRTRWCG
jgi:hypothetical protein